MPGYTITPEDLCLPEVYGDWDHTNPGTHLGGGIGDNKACQGYWNDLKVMPSLRYDAPSGKVGRHFVMTLVVEMQEVQDHPLEDDESL